MEVGLDSVVDRMVERVRHEVPEFADPDHPELWGALRRSAIADTRAGLNAFGTGTPDPLVSHRRQLNSHG